MSTYKEIQNTNFALAKDNKLLTYKVLIKS